MRMTALDLDKVRMHLSYDPLTGQFTRLKTFRSVKTGDIAGTRDESTQSTGKFYIKIGVLGTYVWAHRLAWAMMTGAWSTKEIDHEDQNSENNRWVNLKERTHKENAKNLAMYQSNTSGYPGINIRPNGKYRARIQSEGKSFSLGDWDTPEEALSARTTAKQKLGFHENHC